MASNPWEDKTLWRVIVSQTQTGTVFAGEELKAREEFNVWRRGSMEAGIHLTDSKVTLVNAAGDVIKEHISTSAAT